MFDLSYCDHINQVGLRPRPAGSRDPERPAGPVGKFLRYFFPHRLHSSFNQQIVDKGTADGRPS